jgi:predicted helicase
LDWPIVSADFEDLTFDYTPEELGIDSRNAAKIQEIKRLRPLSVSQPWGIFFVKFEPKRLPVVALRRILNAVVLKKRASANHSERVAWDAEDLLFISNYGEGDARQITFAHFSQAAGEKELPTLKVLGWDNLDTPLHIDDVAETLSEHLVWPEDQEDVNAWREEWRSAFTLRHREVITTSKELSVRLAELARAIRDRIRTALAIETTAGPFTKLMRAFQEALIHDLDADAFADMYAQTITYGLLSARIANPRGDTAQALHAQIAVTNPFLKELMETFLHVGIRRGRVGAVGIDFDELGVNDVIELLDRANMEAVVRDFGDRNPQEDPVVHFYELFLKEYDPQKRMQRGVFYTPRPVVSYIVRSVDALLRREFGLEGGLADTITWGEITKVRKDLKIPKGVSPNQAFVQILDLATGTGTFLVEVIDLIHQTLLVRWEAEGHGEKKKQTLWNEYVPKHLLPRLHGYELLMAPYAIAHLKIGLKLHETGYLFQGDERVRVYLTNSLEPPQDFSGRFAFAIPALAHEAEAVSEIKRKQRFTVVIGNPPYAGLSANMTASAQHLVDAYKFVDGQALNERKIWLQDDYVKFIRTAQLLIEQATVGILGFITNHGYLANPTFRGMRQNLLATFQLMQLLDLHGNANKKELSAGGVDDQNVFEIRQGVAICLAVRQGSEQSVYHADSWGAREEKYRWLTIHSVNDTDFAVANPDSPYYFFEPQSRDWRAEYDTGWKINDIMPVNSAGFITARDHFVVDLDRETLLSRIQAFADPTLTDREVRERYFAGAGSSKYANGDTRGWKLSEARKKVRADRNWRSKAQACLYRPFDVRQVYWADWMVDWPRPELMRHLGLDGKNLALVTTRSVEIGRGFEHVFCTRLVAQHHTVSIKEVNYLFPLQLKAKAGEFSFTRGSATNLATPFVSALETALASERTPGKVAASVAAEDVFFYIYATLHSPTYRNRYSEFLKSDFPRLPLPGSLDLFRKLASCGSELVALHVMEAPKLAHFLTSYVGPSTPEVARVDWSNETVWLDATATRKGRSSAAGTVGFRGVSQPVWEFHIGGYQVCEKWLKDRRGRHLSKDDLVHYQKMVVAVSETIRLMTTVDKVIDDHGGWPGAFVG